MIRILAVVVAVVIGLAFLWHGTQFTTADKPTSELSDVHGKTDGSKIEWSPWTKETFEEAEKKNQLVFLFLSPVWCLDCREMEAKSLEQDSVAELIRNNYSAIKVDPDRYPNIYDRYHLGTYPSCVVLTPDARTIGGSGYLPPDSVYKLLMGIDRMWKGNRPMVLAQAGRLHDLFVKAAQERRPSMPSELLLVLAEEAVERHFDSTYGGFGVQPKFLLPDVNEFLFSAVDPQGRPVFRGATLKTLDGQLVLLDTVWGGFYRYAAFADWTGASYEKLLEINARALSNYLDAYQLLGDEKYRRAAELTIKYIDHFLRAEQGWGFLSSQQGAVIVNNKVLDPKEYFGSSGERRLTVGAPLVDKSLYAAANCYAVSAYLKAMRVLGCQECADYALKTLEMIYEDAKGRENEIHHDLVDPSSAPSGLLADQVACVAALLDAYETAGNRDYLSRAEKIARFITSRLLDKGTGGLNYEPSVAGAIGRMAVAFQPYGTNCDAVAIFMRLYHLTGDITYKETAEGVLRSLLNCPMREDDLRLCKLASAYLWVNRYPVKLVIVGKHGAAYDRLLQGVWKTYYPRSVIAQLEVGKERLQLGELTFPPADQPQLFVCGEGSVSAPISDSATVAEQIREFLRQGKE